MSHMDVPKHQGKQAGHDAERHGDFGMAQAPVPITEPGLANGSSIFIRPRRLRCALASDVANAIRFGATSTNNPSSAIEIDQRQKDVCPPCEAAQSGQDEHILVSHGDLREQFRLPSNQRAAVRVSIAHQICSKRGTFLCAL